MKVLIAQSCPAFATPSTAACQASLSMESSRKESWSGLPFSSAGGVSDPGIEQGVSHMAGVFFTV